MADREQTRRDAQALVENPDRQTLASDPTLLDMAVDVLALLSELEQAELERDEWKAKYEARAEKFPTDAEFYGR